MFPGKLKRVFKRFGQHGRSDGSLMEDYIEDASSECQGAYITYGPMAPDWIINKIVASHYRRYLSDRTFGYCLEEFLVFEKSVRLRT